MTKHKMWHRDIKWANDIEKVVPMDLLDAGLPQTINLCLKKSVSLKQNKLKHNKKKYLCKLQYKTQLTLEAYYTGINKTS